uniref:Strictosidine synthase conserved region domain-containing protein n=1 Tax=Nymphaea colorata TaxID=210225 RepID=A0A5K0XWP9_9MAGN
MGLGGYKEFVHKPKLVKRVIAKSPALFHWIFNTRGKATVINVEIHGKIINYLDDSKGKVMSFATSATEFEDHLYLGNLNTSFIGKLRSQKAKK